MGTGSFDAVIGFIASLSSLLTGLALLNHQRRQPVHFALSLFFLNLAMAFCARSITWHTDGEFHIGFAYSLFAAMPLLLAVFVEHLIRRPVESSFKIATIFCLLFFAATTWSDFAFQTPYWRMGFMVYHLAFLSYLLSQLRRAVKHSAHLVEQERHVINSIFAIVAVSLILIGLEWLRAMNPLPDNSPRLSGLAVLVFTHNLTSVFFNEHRFSLRKEVTTLLFLAAFSVITARLLTVVGVNLGTLYTTSVLIFGSTLLFSTFFLQLMATYSGSGVSRIITQLTSVDKSQVPLTVRDIGLNSEFKILRVVPRLEVEALSCEAMFSVLERGRVFQVPQLRKTLARSEVMVGRESEIDGLQATLYFLLSQGVEALTPIGTTGQLLLASPVALRSPKYFEALMVWAAETIDLVGKANLADKARPNDGVEVRFPFRSENLLQ
jgi:hypothetical protein